MEKATLPSSQPSNEPSSTASAYPTPAARGSSIARVIDTSHSEMWTLEDLEAYALANGYLITLLNLTNK